ncbi:serine hydrolase [Microterricola viridarii]|uniref:Beta-lactamase class A n=1 Tax=Microterricola viridarii TaxID=412690 RepID=A0A1H1LRW8_9MICO|nr:serine hydrolase [Microterricola viridarii]SDR77296.1 beta-lactamase class A [Microterricola viridarii]
MTSPAPQSERRVRQAALDRGRHQGGEANDNFGRGFSALADLAVNGVQLTARASDLATGRVLFSVDDHVSVPTAGIGKVLLLIEVAAQMSDPDFEPAMAGGLAILDRAAGDAVGAEGLWQHLQAPSLPVADLAALVGASGDNLASNVLLRVVGLDAVRTRAESLGLSRTALLDIVRDRRGPDDAPQLSVGSAGELAALFTALARGEVVSPEVSQRVVGWLSLHSDLSMVASAFGLVPLAHRASDHGLLLVNMTGTAAGIRSEVGVLRGPRAGVSYMVSMQFADTTLAARLEVLDGMRQVGLDLLEYVH